MRRSAEGFCNGRIASLVLAAVVAQAAAAVPRESLEVQHQHLRTHRDVNESAPVSWPAFILSKVKEIPDALERISIDVSYDNIWEEIITFPERKPYSFNVILATVKTFSADLMVQLGTKTSIDWHRSVAFALFGCFYVGLAQWYFYVSLFSELCPHAIHFANEPLSAKINDSLGLQDLVRQVFYDNLILEAFIYFPVFYTIKEAINSLCAPTSPTEVSTGSADFPLAAPLGRKGPLETALVIMGKGLGAYRKNFFVDNSLGCAMWIPGDFLIYSAPMFLRMPFDHALSFIWTMGLSYMRGAGASSKKSQDCFEGNRKLEL